MATAALEAPALPQLSASDTKFLRALKKFTDSEFTVEPNTASQAKKETAQQIATLSYFSLVAETLTACAN
ncbi:hypothetical protein, partial [Escherichia coli]|uniref:hypothetical protein n=1 Tax=Escherichia coli TaxID=562 RepID=UPI0039E111FF